MTKSVDMTPDTKPALTPKLRFPEFRGNKSWNTTILGSLAEVVRGGSPRPIDDFLTTASDGLNWLKIGDVDKEAKFVTQTAEKVRAEALSKTRIVNPGDLILSNSMSFGRPYILQITTCIHDGWIAITEITKWAERDFLYYSISAPTSQTYFTNNAAGSGVQNLNADIIKSLKIAFPSNAEQQKIAECLGSLDELIATEIRKLDALKAHKKGLMQQLFPRPGESTPRLRFPEFQDAPEWEETQLGQLAYYENGKAYEQDIVENGKYVVVNSRFISTNGAVRKYTNADYLIAKAGEVLMVLSDLPKGKALAKCYFVETDNRYAVNQRICRLKPKEINGKFLYYVLNRHPRLLAFDDGLNQTHLSKGGVTECQLCVPQDKDEQHRIADCLTSLDSQIAAQTTRLATLRTHKQGLMRQLFPSPEKN